jgi:hypothetical protein
MPDYTAIQFRDNRYRKRVCGAQRRDDELLGVIADLQGS